MSVEISLIIPTYNTRDITLACIEDLLQRPPNVSHEIIVVDNNSTDETAELVREKFPSIQVVANTLNEGFGRACNQGASKAKGRFLCFLNSDTLRAGEAVDTLLAWMETHPKTGLAAPRFETPEGLIQQMSWGWSPVLFGELIQQYFAPYALRRSRWKTGLAKHLQKKSRSVEIVCGACMVMRRNVFDQINGFDPTFELYFEDSDLSVRTHQAGWNVDFCAEARVVHHLGQSSRGSWGLTPLVYRQSQIRYYHKHAPRWSLPLLRIYQCSKWLRIRLLLIFTREKRSRIERYLTLFWDVIWEKRTLRLSENYFV